MRILLAVCFLANPLFAQTLDPRYEPVGSFEGAFGEAAIVLNLLFDLEKERSMVRIRDASGFETISISARTIGGDGKPTNPSVSFTIGPIGAGGAGVRSDVYFGDKSGGFVTDNDIGGRVTLADFSRDGTKLSFSIDATLQPVKRGDDGFVIDDARTSQQFSGTFSGELTVID